MSLPSYGLKSIICRLYASWRYWRGPRKEQDKKAVGKLVGSTRAISRRIYAGAPVRSRPRRTYDPAHLASDPEGDYIPMFLASQHFEDEEHWGELQDALQRFGQDAGLFDEISIKALGKQSGPFQLQIRRFDGAAKGPQRNLIDVGYGVSQVLPVVTELLRKDAPAMFLLQQPEVHLHPSAPGRTRQPVLPSSRLETTVESSKPTATI